MSEVNSVGSCAVLLGGSEGAVGWLMVISWVVTVVACSRGRVRVWDVRVKYGLLVIVGT